MAGLGLKKFQSGDILTHIDVNGYFMSQVVAYFATVSARTAFFTTSGNEVLLFAGRLVYMGDSNSIWIYNGAEWTEQTAIVADGSISSIKLRTVSGSEAVVTTSIRDSAVTSAKIAASSITYDKFAPTQIDTISGTTYTLALADANKTLKTTSSSATTITVPANGTIAFPIGTEIYILQYGSGQVTVSAASGAVVRSDSSRVKIKTQYSSVSLLKIDTNEWVLTGNLGV
jgi:hypothetical protein